MKALIRIASKYRPISGELLGFRLEATVPNLAARRMKKTSKGFVATAEEVPSFRKPYLILESGDHASKASITAADIARFQERLEWEGFHEFDLLTEVTAPAPSEKVIADLRRAGFTV